MVDPILLGGVIGVTGTAVGALISLAAEPIKLWATQRSRKENLRLALYGEIATVILFFSERAASIFGMPEESLEAFGQAIDALKNAPEVLKNAPNGLRVLTDAPSGLWAILQFSEWESASYDVYTNVKTTDPTLFYQLDEHAAIDQTYLALRMHDTQVKMQGLDFTQSPSQAKKNIQDNLTLTKETIFKMVALDEKNKMALDKKLLSKVGLNVREYHPPNQGGAGNEAGNEAGNRR